MKRGIINKYVLLAVLVIAVFALPSCRTRITNNSEVSNIQYDEDGYLTDTYQMRRDELGLSTAERPLLPDFGSGETEENDDFSEGEEINYNPEDYQEDFTEPETPTDTNTNTNTNTNRNSGNTPRRTTPTPSRRSPSGTNTSTVSVTFNANGGTIDGKKSKTVSIKKGNKLGTLPTAKHSNTNMEFEGWFTSKTGGSSVKSTDKVNSSTTLYAHWKDNTPETKYYNITIDPANGDAVVTKEVKEGDTYTLASDDKPFYKGHAFIGWSGNNGKDYKVGDKVDSEVTLTAQWEDWFDKYTDASDGKSGKTCLILNSDSAKEEFITNCKCGFVVSDENDFDYVIVFDSKPADAYETASANENYKGKVIALSNKAIESSDAYEQLLYKIVVLEKIYGGIKYQDAQKDMNLEASFKDKD